LKTIFCAGLGQLSRLDLSQSGLAAVPRGELCGLTALTHLNLSSNRVEDLADLGLGSQDAAACALPLGSLDLSGTVAAVRYSMYCTVYISIILPPLCCTSLVMRGYDTGTCFTVFFFQSISLRESSILLPYTV
jgi:Leucine-rich repeat (LRR) protein